MNPFNVSAPIGFVAGCATCEDKCHKCDPCHKPDCACPEPFIGLDKVPYKGATYRINDNGKTALWDLNEGVNEAQTDTSLIINVIDRLLQFSAERHTDSISAQELGSILHLADLGDVSTKGADNGATMVFKKGNTCSSGCVGSSNVWEPWNALDIDNMASSTTYGYGFDADGIPVTIQQPANLTEYYNLGWNGQNQLGYSQPPFEDAVILDTDEFAWQMYINPNNMQPYYVKVKVS